MWATGMERRRYATALEAYTRDEPLPWAEFYVGRASLLSRIGRQGSSQDALAQLAELRVGVSAEDCFTPWRASDKSLALPTVGSPPILKP